MVSPGPQAWPQSAGHGLMGMVMVTQRAGEVEGGGRQWESSRGRLRMVHAVQWESTQYSQSVRLANIRRRKPPHAGHRGTLRLESVAGTGRCERAAASP